MFKSSEIIKFINPIICTKKYDFAKKQQFVIKLQHFSSNSNELEESSVKSIKALLHHFLEYYIYFKLAADITLILMEWKLNITEFLLL